MGKPHGSTIHLNGKVYDLQSGQRVSGAQKHSAITPSKAKAIPVATGKMVDGVVRRKPSTTHQPAPAAHKKVQKSKTLMRSVVHKPTAAKKSIANHYHLAKPVLINPEREARSQRVSKSRLVSRFGAKHDTSFAPQIAPLAVQPEPSVPEHTAVLTNHFESAVVTVPKNHKVPHTNPFEAALARATSHTEAKPDRQTRTHRTARKLHTTPKRVRALAIMILLLGIGGFFVHQNIPRLAMRLAATRAGIAAKLPGYQPSGFSLNGNIQYSSGEVKVSYLSNSDDRQFTITQKATDLTNTSLQPTQVLGANTSFQTVENQDKTIYIDDQNRATWVEQGILYEITGEGLSSDQLLRLANSL